MNYLLRVLLFNALFFLFVISGYSIDVVLSNDDLEKSGYFTNGVVDGKVISFSTGTDIENLNRENMRLSSDIIELLNESSSYDMETCNRYTKFVRYFSTALVFSGLSYFVVDTFWL